MQADPQNTRTSLPLFVLDEISIVDVTGEDADAIVHNLTTNDVRALQQGQGCETFVTDVRGKTIGHFFAYRIDGALRLIGAPGQSDSFASHVDKYTIREDATAVIRDDDFVAIVLPPATADRLSLCDGDGEIKCDQIDLAGSPCWIATNRWLGEGTQVILVAKSDVEPVLSWLENQSDAEIEFHRGDIGEFHRLRTLAPFPWYGVDLDANNLPQELDRDAQAISFTKGCYLGQETVARLDALGQVQKKWVRWLIRGGVPPAGLTLQSDGKVVGRLTSIATDDDEQVIAMGYARRSHFDPGSKAEGVVEDTNQSITGVVD